MKVAIALAGCLMLAVSAANASTIVDLSAASTTPNAGKNSGTYAYNPVVISLAAGTYSVGVVGKAAGGMFDAYSVYADNGSNAAWTDSAWSVSLNGGATAAYTQGNLGRSNTALGALATYGSASPYMFTLTSSQNVSFYVDDTAYPYFGDDAGGVSLAVSSVQAQAVPEPASLTLLGAGLAATVVAMRRRRRIAGQASSV